MAERPLRPLPLFYSDHALKQMEERHFSRDDVKRILYTGTVSQSSYQPPPPALYRHARDLAFGPRVARVIFTQPPMRYDIVTVEWVYDEKKE